MVYQDCFISHEQLKSLCFISGIIEAMTCLTTSVFLFMLLNKKNIKYSIHFLKIKAKISMLVFI